MARFVPRIILFLALVLAIVIALGMRFLNEDLFVALCAGRDVVQGKLAQPDTWAFTTDGKVWVNQGWLSHLFLYFSYEALHDLGPVVWKTVLLMLCAGILCIRCRRLGASTEVSLVAVTIGTLSVAPFLQIRAENFGVVYFLVVATLVTAPGSWGRLRQAGTALMMMLWVNSHGSFVLGLALIGINLALELVRAAAVARGRVVTEPKAVVWREPLTWFITLASCLVLAAFVNPYGTTNLFMPHRQLSAGSVTAISADWVPLLDWRSLSEKALFHPLDVRPFLAAVLLILVLGGAALGTARTRPRYRAYLTEFRGRIGWDVEMEVLIPLLVVPLSFPFRRIILFAGVSLVPLLALLMRDLVGARRDSAACGSVGAADTISLSSKPQSAPHRKTHKSPLPPLCQRGEQEGGRLLPPFCKGGLGGILDSGESADHAPALNAGHYGWNRPFSRIMLAVCWLLVPAWIFFRTTLPPYLPGNPTRAERPLIAQLMSFDSYTTDAIQFMKRNAIEGRLFTSWVISDFLLFHLPGIQVFMDCRDQSAYSDDIIQKYFATLGANEGRPATMDRALEILSRYKVSAVVMETRPAGFRFATILMATRKWACIFKDDEVFVLSPVDSERFGSWVSQGKLPPLWFPDKITRAISAALLSFSMTGRLTPETRAELERIVEKKPDSSIYGLLYLSALEPNGCLRPELKSFFLSEVVRLSAMDPMTPRLGKPILESLIRLVSALESEEQTCSSRTRPFPFEAARKALEERLTVMERKYLGYTP